MKVDSWRWGRGLRREKGIFKMVKICYMCPPVSQNEHHYSVLHTCTNKKNRTKGGQGHKRQARAREGTRVLLQVLQKPLWRLFREGAQSPLSLNAALLWGMAAGSAEQGGGLACCPHEKSQ